MGKNEHNKLKSTSLNGCLILLFIGLFLLPITSYADISINSYCQLTIEEMQQQTSDYQELIALANQYEDDPRTLTEQEAIKRAEFDQEKQARYSAFGATAEEYVLYMGKNSSAVNTYLNDNPDIKQQMDDLKAQLNALAAEHHALKEALIQQPALPVD